MSSAHDHDGVLPIMADSNVGPGIGDNDPGHSATPPVSPTLSFVTAAEEPDDQANLDVMTIAYILNPVQVDDEAIGPANQAGAVMIDGAAIAQPEGDINEDLAPGLMTPISERSDAATVMPEPAHGHQDDDLPEYDNIVRVARLPKLYTIAGQPADLTTPIDEFRSFGDYKLMCLAGPKITVILVEATGVIELSCARKLLRDFSPTFQMIDLMIGEDRLDVAELFANLPIKSAAATFIQLYELMQAGGLPVPVSGDVSFMSLIDMATMADFLVMPKVKGVIGTFIKAKLQELTANWKRDYDTARKVQNVPAAQRTVGHLFDVRLTPMKQHVFKLLDIQDAYVHARFNPRANVVLPSELAQLVAEACPAELRFRLEATGQLRPGFQRAVALSGLQRRVEARRGFGRGQRR